MSASLNCEHLKWFNGRCPECGKILTLDEKFNATIRNIQHMRSKDKQNRNAPFLDYAEVTMVELGQEIRYLKDAISTLSQEGREE